MEFTKEKTDITKGVAICLMFCNHLYSFPNRLLNGNYYMPTIPFFDTEFYVGNFGNICISMFVFLSGYGMFLGYANSDRNSFEYSFKKIKDFYFTYWIYFLIFVPIGLIFFKDTTIWNSNEIRYSIDLIALFEGFIGWSARYNSEWWFVRMFILLLFLLSPIYLKLGKQNSILLFLVSTGLCLFSYALKIDYTSEFGFIFWQISFAIGILCARLKFFSSAFIQYFENFKIIWLFLYIILFFTIRFRVGAKIDFLFTPIFIYLVVRMIEGLKLSKILAYIGKYSFPIWLVHSFFCYYYFQDFIYSPKWSPLIFTLLVSTSLLSVLVVENFRFHFQNFFANRRSILR